DSQGLVFYLQYELRLADQRVQQIKNGRRPPFTFFRRNGQCRTDFADIQNKKECGGNRQWQNHYLRNWAANTKGKGII
ncbi:hypothetical protein ACUYVI_001913, partial [Campylobacter jejuni]